MNSEKREKLVDAMRIISEALADDGYSEYLTEDVLDGLDVTDDLEFACAMHTWSKMMTFDRTWLTGMFCDGVASHDLREPDLVPTRNPHNLRVAETFEIPLWTVDGEVREWQIVIVGQYDGKAIMVNGSLIYKTEKLLTKDDFAGKRDFEVEYLPEIDSATVATMLIRLLDASRIDGIDAEEAEKLKTGLTEAYRL